MATEDDLLSAARARREEMDVATARQLDAEHAQELLQQQALAHADARAAELQEAADAFMRLMQRAGNPGLEKYKRPRTAVSSGERFKGWCISKTQPDPHSAGWEIWYLTKRGEWWGVTSRRGSVRDVLREHINLQLRVGTVRDIQQAKRWVDQMAQRLKMALADTLARNGIA